MTDYTLYQTRYYGPTNTRGSRIRVQWLSYSGLQTRWESYDSQYNPGAAHRHAVAQATGTDDGQWLNLSSTLDDKGYIFMSRDAIVEYSKQGA